MGENTEIREKKPKRRRPPLKDCRDDPAIDAAVSSMALRIAHAVLDLVPFIRRAEEIGHWRELGCASLTEFAELRGLPPALAYVARTLAYVFAIRPDLEEVIRSGRQSCETVAALLPFLEDPTLLKEGESLEGLMEEECASDIRRLARERRLEQKKDDPEKRIPRRLDFTEKGAQDLERAREHESQRLQREASRVEVVETALREFLSRKDPLERKELPTRRMPDTAGRPGRPMAKRTVVWLKQGYGCRCPVNKCPHRLFIEKAHIQAWAEEGDQEATNIFPPCTAHHVLFDGKKLTVRVEGGRRFLVNKYGLIKGEILDPPEIVLPEGRRAGALPLGTEEKGRSAA